ncbi:MAG: 50S ribosomal protein L3, partial [Thermotoga sp.]
MKAILGRKVGMTQLYIEGKAIPVTVIQAGPCYITQIKTEQKDGYNAVQLGYKNVKKMNKP